jgi:hypothetical protein
VAAAALGAARAAPAAALTWYKTGLHWYKTGLHWFGDSVSLEFVAFHNSAVLDGNLPLDHAGRRKLHRTPGTGSASKLSGVILRLDQCHIIILML